MLSLPLPRDPSLERKEVALRHVRQELDGCRPGSGSIALAVAIGNSSCDEAPAGLISAGKACQFPSIPFLQLRLILGSAGGEAHGTCVLCLLCYISTAVAIILLFTRLPEASSCSRIVCCRGGWPPALFKLWAQMFCPLLWSLVATGCR